MPCRALLAAHTHSLPAASACVLVHAQVGFSSLAAHADTADCILTLNRMFSAFDTLTDKYGVHKMDTHNDCYIAAVGHAAEDRAMSGVLQAKRMVELAREMLSVVRSMDYPDTLGKMELRIGIHLGPVYAGVVGIKFPRYALFGTTMRLALGLQHLALPMTVHVSEMVHNRVRQAGGELFSPFTTSSYQVRVRPGEVWEATGAGQGGAGSGGGGGLGLRITRNAWPGRQAGCTALA